MPVFGRRERDVKQSDIPAEVERHGDADPASASVPSSLPDEDNPWLKPMPVAPVDAVTGSDVSSSGEQRPSVRRGPGRPARGDAKRTHRVGLSLSADEFEGWSAFAQLDGYSSLARWARDRVNGTLNQALLHRLGATKGMSDAARLRGDLAKVGSNLNQVARALNVAERGGPGGPSVSEVLAAVDATRRELAAVRAWTRGQE